MIKERFQNKFNYIQVNSLKETLITETVVPQEMRIMILKTIKKAKRLGVWKRIRRIERGILSLSSSLRITFKSVNLLKAIVTILKEIKQLISFTYKNYILGQKTAYKIARYAAENGYQQAAEWAKDINYIVWWGVFLNPLTYTGK